MTNKDAIKWLKYMMETTDFSMPQYEKAIETAISALERQTGEWIDVTNGRGGHECSLCHEYAPSYKNGDEWITKYCPNCGAKMVEPRESEDKE